MTRAWTVALLLMLPACQHTPDAPASPAARREQAVALIDSGEPAKAIPALEALRAGAPADLELARLEAEAYVKAGRGEALLQKVGAAEGSASGQYQRGLVLFALAADATPEAVGAMEKAIALTPGAAELHYRLGLMHLEAERFPAALPALERAAQLEPKRPAFLLPLAKARARTGDTHGALEALRTLVTLQPTPAQVATGRAIVAELSDPAARVPQAAKSRIDQAIQWLDTHDVPHQAIIELESALREFPDLALAHALLGLAYQRLDDAGRAVDEFRQAIALAPDHGRFHLMLANLYLARQRPDQARTELEKAVALDPLLSDAHARLGDLALERRDLAVARRHFELLTTLEPQSPAAKVKLAAALQLQGDWSGADQQLRAALEKEPANVELQLRLGLLNFERSRATQNRAERQRAAGEAEVWLRKVLDAQPDNALASRALEQLRQK